VTFVGAVIDPRFREVVPFFEAAARRISDRGRGLARLPCPAAGEQAMEDGLLTDTGETCTFSVDAIHSVFAVTEQLVLVDRRIYLHAQRANRGMECSGSQPSMNTVRSRNARSGARRSAQGVAQSGRQPRASWRCCQRERYEHQSY
jgi:hypothetical protein